MEGQAHRFENTEIAQQEYMFLSLLWLKEASQTAPWTITLLVFKHLLYWAEQRAATAKLFIVMYFIAYDNFHQSASAFNVFTCEIAAPLISALLLLPPPASHHRITDDCQWTPHEQLSLPSALTLQNTVKSCFFSTCQWWERRGRKRGKGVMMNCVADSVIIQRTYGC